MSPRALLAAAAALVVLIPVAAAPALACDGPPVCTVVDPTGTPLNVRSGPNGKILSNLRKGSKVEVVDHSEHKGKRWARVAKFQEASFGWVFEAYLKCKQDPGNLPVCTVSDPTGTPLNVRHDPGGEIAGSWINGINVRQLERKMHKGKPWVLVERTADDNAIGWVYDPYLKCEEDDAM
jgi:SH3-like domain-containing protein